MTEGEEIKTKNKRISLAGYSQFLNPEMIVNQLEIVPGMEIAHFGCGSGFFTFPLVKKVGEEGMVFALDILENKLDLIKSRVKAEGLKNVFTKQVNLENKNGSGLGNESVDWVIMVNMLHQNEKKSRIISEAKRVLKEKGKILLIDWSTDGPLGPSAKVRVSKEDLIKIIRKNGLGISGEIDTGNFCFGMILTK